MHEFTSAASKQARPARCLIWTPQADARLSQMAREGASIRALALAFGIGRQAAQQRAQKLGALDPANRKSSQSPAKSKATLDQIDLARDSLPAGHLLTWGLINQGTCLEGLTYPVPETARLRRKLRTLRAAVT